MTGFVSDDGEVMSSYDEYALSDWFELAQYVQTTGYCAAVYVAGTWLHKISIDERWKWLLSVTSAGSPSRTGIVAAGSIRWRLSEMARDISC